MSVAILCFAAFNSYEEQLPTWSFYISTVIGAIIAPALAVTSLLIALKLSNRINIPLLIVAYLSLTFGFLVYFKYAFNGKADNMETAAHMHVIAFPFLHSALTIIAIIIAVIISLVIRTWLNFIDRRGT